MKTIDQRFCETIIPVYRRQLHLQEQLGKSDWGFNLHEAILALSSGEQWSVQILGMETEGLWAWAWTDGEGHLREDSKYAADRLLTIGKEEEIEAFTTPKIQTDRFACKGHSLAVVAASFHMNDAPYLAVTDGPVTIYSLVTDMAYPAEMLPCTARELGMLLPTLLSNYEISDPRLALTSAFEAYGLQSEVKAETICWRDEEASFTLSFDESGKVSNIEGKLEGGSESPEAS